MKDSHMASFCRAAAQRLMTDRAPIFLGNGLSFVATPTDNMFRGFHHLLWETMRKNHLRSIDRRELRLLEVEQHQIRESSDLAFTQYALIAICRA